MAHNIRNYKVNDGVAGKKLSDWLKRLVTMRDVNVPVAMRGRRNPTIPTRPGLHLTSIEYVDITQLRSLVAPAIADHGNVSED